MIFRTSAAVHDWRSVFSSSITAALQTNSISASMPNRLFAYGQTFANQVSRWSLYCCRIALGAVEFAADAVGASANANVAIPAMQMILLAFLLLLVMAHFE